MIGLALALLTGMALRLAYPGDIEWKADEQWTFEQAQLMASQGTWPAVGMATSVGGYNPGLSVWIFGGLTKLFAIQTPPQLAQAVQVLNCLALLSLAGFAFTLADRGRRELWLWAAALWALNPLAIILERKIWPPSVLPIFFVAFLACWNARRAAPAAFFWGLLGALMAQLHLGAVFLVMALLVWTWLADRTSVNFFSWLAGSIVGALPAIPWLIALASQPGGGIHTIRIPIALYFVRWIPQSMGFGVEYSLGPVHGHDFIKEPIIAGHETFLIALVYMLIALIGIYVVAAAVVKLLRQRPSFTALLVGNSEESVLINACFWGYGSLLTLITVFGAGSHRHYAIIVASVMALWCARVFLQGGIQSKSLQRQLLAIMCVAQGCISLGFIEYIHRVQVIDYEYGATWQSQQKPPPVPKTN